MNKENDSENTNGLLASIKNNSPFRAPEGYFDTFPDRLKNRIEVERKARTATISHVIWKPYLAAAILLIVALVAGKYIFDRNSDRNAEDSFHSEISQMVDQELYSIDESTIVEVLGKNDAGYPNNTFVTHEEVIDYLVNGDLDENDLIDAL